MNESVSIVIPTRNRSAILARCLAALPAGAAGLDPPEVIVVDDCSSDPTAQIVEEFARSCGWSVQCLRQERPQGANAARNRGIHIARGEIVVMIDDDVLATEGWLAKLLSGLSHESPVSSGSVRLTVEGPIHGKHRTALLFQWQAIWPRSGGFSTRRVLTKTCGHPRKKAIGSGAPASRHSSSPTHWCGITRLRKKSDLSGYCVWLGFAGANRAGGLGNV